MKRLMFLAFLMLMGGCQFNKDSSFQSRSLEEENENGFVQEDVEKIGEDSEIKEIDQKDFSSKNFSDLNSLSFSFDRMVPSGVIEKNEFQIQGVIPNAREVIENAKKDKKINFLPFIQKVVASDIISLPIFQIEKKEIQKKDATEFANKLGFTGEPKELGEEGGYHEFVWEKEEGNNLASLAVSVGIYGGGFTYELKGKAKKEKAPEGKEAISQALRFVEKLEKTGVLENNFYEVNVVGNIESRMKVGGIEEDKSQVYLRKSLEGIPVYEWEKAENSPLYDEMEVWVGVDGRILYANHNALWSTPNLQKKEDFYLKEPEEAFEEIKNGKGRIAWVNMVALGYDERLTLNPAIVLPEFGESVKFTDVEMKEVKIVYFHDSRGLDIGESVTKNQKFFEDKEAIASLFYVPVYVFKADTILKYKDGYYQQKGEEKAEKHFKELYDNKKTEVYFLVSAVKERVDDLN